MSKTHILGGPGVTLCGRPTRDLVRVVTRPNRHSIDQGLTCLQCLDVWGADYGRGADRVVRRARAPYARYYRKRPARRGGWGRR